MSDTLASQTLDRVAAAMRKGPPACLPEIVRLISSLSGNSVNVSVSELADVIQQDPVVLTKVLAAANTLGYNPNGVQVSGVTQAIHVIGYERIRTLAMSLMLMKHVSDGQSDAERQQAVAQALTAGCIAQSAAKSRMLLDPEQAFVCAALRNFGRIVLATYLTDEYKAAAEVADAETDDEAWRAHFGLTPLELGRQLLKASDLPEEIMAALRELPASALASLDTAPSAQMLAVSDFSSRLAALALKPELSAADFARQSKALAARYQRSLPALGEEIADLIASAETQYTTFARTFGLKGMANQSLVRLRQRCAGIDPSASVLPPRRPAAEIAAEPPKPPVPAPETPAAAAVEPAPSPSRPPLPEHGAHPPAPIVADFDWAGGAAHVASLLQKPGVSRDEIMVTILAIVQRGLAAAEGLLFTIQPGGVGRLSHGRGEVFTALRDSAAIRAAERTVFGVCLSRHENVFIHSAHDPKIQPYLPAWWTQARAIGSFVLLPLGAPKATTGLILAGWRDAHQIVIGQELNKLIRPLLFAASMAGRRE
jgi:HD-like signal output (HDOD) protein